MNREEYLKTYYQKNKDKIKEYKKEFRNQNRDKLNERNKKYYENNKDKKKEYYENNKDKILEYKKEFRNQNIEKFTKKDKEYYENNKEKILEYHKEYRESNPEKYKEYYKENKEQIAKRNQEYHKCRSCKLFSTRKATNYLCSYCNPDKATRQKTKEMAVKTFLEENNYTFIYNKKCNLDKSCQTYYPDFLIDCNTFFIIIECDENGHSSYPIECEKIRENNIYILL